MQTSHSLNIEDIYTDEGYQAISEAWNLSAWDRKEFDKASWLGLRSKQLLPDIFLIQEVISRAKPEVILETGTGKGGTTLLAASLLFFLGGEKLITIDHITVEATRKGIAKFPLLNEMIYFIVGSSIEVETAEKARSLIEDEQHVMLLLDAGHTKDYVHKELLLYSSFLQQGDYIIVCDTNMVKLSVTPRGNPQWVVNSAYNGVRAFLQENDNFEIEHSFDHWMTTSCIDGILRHK